MTQSKKNSFYKKRLQLYAKRRKPIAVFFLPQTTSMDAINQFMQILRDRGIDNDYHTMITVSEEPHVEIHGASKLTSFELNELQKYILDELPKIIQG